jgi:hypothetical protein
MDEDQELELTGTRRTIMRAAWWGIAVCGAWLAVVWPLDAYTVSPHCNPPELYSANAGNPVTLLMGLMAVGTALRALRRPAATSIRVAWLLVLALPLAFIEWIVMYMQVEHRCGTTITEAWFAAPTRDAAVVIAFCGPILLVLGFVLIWRERRSTPQIATAQVVTDQAPH